MSVLRKYMVKNAFKEYLPATSDFEIVEEPIPALKKGEFLVKTEYISVDPYMRSFAKEHRVPYSQFGFQVGKVIESQNKGFPVDVYVVSHSGWRDFVVLDDRADVMFGMKPYQPPIGMLRPSLALGALGMPGITAYLGFLEICKPTKDDVVCVTSAAGAVGSLVGQIALLKECKVIGFAGTDQKVQMLKNELGFHYAFNYKTESDVKEKLKTVAPKGINCFFDNVGGNLGKQIISCMAENGRVAICGAISMYGQVEKPAAQSKGAHPPVGVRVESFSFTQWPWPTQLDALQHIREWIEKGSVKTKETITEGFDCLPIAFISMLKGDNVGKNVVKV